jgi:hypothetical protein
MVVAISCAKHPNCTWIHISIYQWTSGRDWHLSSSSSRMLPNVARKLVWCCFISLICTQLSHGIEDTVKQPGHRAGLRQLLGEYKQADAVPLWASKVGPFANPR